MTPPAVAIHDWIRKGFQFHGRSSRSDYWWTRLLVLTINLVLVFLFASAIGEEAMQALAEWLSELTRANTDAVESMPLDWADVPAVAKFSLIFLIVFALLTFVPDLSLSWRRYHDMNLPGWLHLLFVLGGAYLPMVGLIELIWFIRRGTPGPNRYGPDPVRPD